MYESKQVFDKMTLECLTISNANASVSPKVCQKELTRVQINYFKGWNIIPKYCSKIPSTCYIPVTSERMEALQEGELLGQVITLHYPMNFSWGWGPTKPVSKIILLKNGECGFFQKDQIMIWRGVTWTVAE